VFAALATVTPRRDLFAHVDDHFCEQKRQTLSPWCCERRRRATPIISDRMISIRMTRYPRFAQMVLYWV
jgi:hypothetical protein